MFKDKKKFRTTAFNVVQTFDFMVTGCHSYLKRKIVDVPNYKALNTKTSRYFISTTKTEDLKCIYKESHLSEVLNTEKGS